MFHTEGDVGLVQTVIDAETEATYLRILLEQIPHLEKVTSKVLL